MKKINTIPDQSLDLLVDGELDDFQREELLKHMERNPDIWRDCALRFLEAAALRETFVRRQERRSHEETGILCHRSAGFAGQAMRGLCIAASLLCAGLAGFFARDWAGNSEPVLPASALETAESESLAHITTGYGKALEEGIVWEPQLRWDGAMSYVTRQQVPSFIRDAVLMAGHRVEREERVVRLGNPEGSGERWKIPVSETRIIENRPL